MTDGIIVARDGYAVESATVLQQVFNSGLNTLKVSSTGTIVSNGSGTRTVTYDTGLDYQAGFLAWYELSGNNTWYAAGFEDVNTGSSVECWIDSDGVFNAGITSGSNVIVKYLILVDPGT